MTFSKITTVLIIVFLFLSIGGLIGLLVYTLLQYPENTVYTVPVNKYVSCILNPNDTKDICLSRQCIWNDNVTSDYPLCAFHEASYGYILSKPTENTDWGKKVTLQRQFVLKEFEATSSHALNIDIEYQTDYRLRIKIYDNKSRFEIPEDVLKIQSVSLKPSNLKYDVEIVDGEKFFGIKVIRKENAKVIFDTDFPGFIFSDQFHQITTQLSSDAVYGFGEHNHKRLRHDMQWRTWSMFARDVGVVDDWNLYGVHPFYLNLESDGKANGVLLLNSNAMDVILQPLPAITYRVIGGILDFYIFLGSTPENVIQQYTEAIGRPFLPPYWILGFQLSRWGYNDLTSLTETINRNWKQGIPYDVQYCDIDCMDAFKPFTYDKENFKGLPELIEDLHKRNQKFITIVDPGIPSKVNASNYEPLQLGTEMDIFVKTTNDNPYEGMVWPNFTYYPDFLHPNITNYWIHCSKDLYYNQNIKFDALWIDMNEPSNFQDVSTNYCEKNTWNNPPYATNILGAAHNNVLYEKTICMDNVHYNNLRHYDVHSLYGHTMAQASHRTLLELFPKKRPLVLTRSTFVGSGHYAAHWLGDNHSKWPHLHWSIIGMLEFNFFGIPLTGSDICGFWFQTDEEMCLRWSLLGAFYPFARNHNGNEFEPQDPASFGEEFVNITKKYLQERYRLLPYLYSLFYYSHIDGSTIVRPLFFEFSEDHETWSIDTQFLWGSALLISPALEKGQQSVEVYFPQAQWYNYFTGEVQNKIGKQLLPTPKDVIHVHIRGGYILPTQEPAQTTTDSRKNEFGLVIALDQNGFAEGNLFWDDGVSAGTVESGSYSLIYFNFSKSQLNISSVHLDSNNNEFSLLKLSLVKIFGMNINITGVIVDDVSLTSEHITYNQTNQVLVLDKLNLKLVYNHFIEIKS